MGVGVAADSARESGAFCVDSAAQSGARVAERAGPGTWALLIVRVRLRRRLQPASDRACCCGRVAGCVYAGWGLTRMVAGAGRLFRRHARGCGYVERLADRVGVVTSASPDRLLIVRADVVTLQEFRDRDGCAEELVLQDGCSYWAVGIVVRWAGCDEGRARGCLSYIGVSVTAACVRRSRRVLRGALCRLALGMSSPRPRSSPPGFESVHPWVLSHVTAHGSLTEGRRGL